MLAQRVAPLAALITAAAAAPVPGSGKYKVASATITLKDPAGTAIVKYPEAAVADAGVNGTAGKFSFLSFAHGGATAAVAVDGWYGVDMETIASYGTVVVATTVNMAGSDPLWSHQQLAVIKSCKADPSLHASFASVDWTRTGVSGHSMGGIATSRSLAEATADLGIRAGWAQHPCGVPSPTKNKHPTLYTTGTSEPGPFGIGCQQSSAENGYKQSVNAKPRILFNIVGANHGEPMSGGLCPCPHRELIPGSLFLSCHLNDDQDACAKIYESPGICAMQYGPTKYTLKECKVEGSPSPVPPAPPAPPAQLYTCSHNVCVAAAKGLRKSACEAACGSV